MQARCRPQAPRGGISSSDLVTRIWELLLCLGRAAPGAAVLDVLAASLEALAALAAACPDVRAELSSGSITWAAQQAHLRRELPFAALQRLQPAIQKVTEAVGPAAIQKVTEAVRPAARPRMPRGGGRAAAAAESAPDAATQAAAEKATQATAAEKQAAADAAFQALMLVRMEEPTTHA